MSRIARASQGKQTRMRKQRKTRREPLPLEEIVPAPSGSVFFTVSAACYVASIQDNALVVSTNEGVYRATLRNGFSTPLTTVNVARNGSCLVAGSRTGEVLAWETSGFALRLANRAAATLIAPILDIECSPRGNFLAALTSTREVQVWDIFQRLCLHTARVDDETTSLTWAEDESCVIGCPTGETLVVLEPVPPTRTHARPSAHYFHSGAPHDYEVRRFCSCSCPST